MNSFPFNKKLSQQNIDGQIPKPYYFHSPSLPPSPTIATAGLWRKAPSPSCSEALERAFGEWFEGLTIPTSGVEPVKASNYFAYNLSMVSTPFGRSPLMRLAYLWGDSRTTQGKTGLNIGF